MRRINQLVFTASILGLSWLAMMAVHELGHVAGAIITGGTVERVVLHPLTISRTDVMPNPHPAIVVWLGPIVGCALPLAVFTMMPQHRPFIRRVAQFFAGFCLIANGVYISLGCFDRVGDCGVMLRTGTPPWMLFAFGAVTIPWGLYLWHRLGSLRHFLADPSIVTGRVAFVACATMIAIAAAGFALFPR